MADLLVVVGVYLCLLAIGGALIERHETWFTRMSDEIFGDEQE